MAGLNRITEHALPPGTENGADLRKDIRLILKRDAVPDCIPQRPRLTKSARMAEAGRPVGGVVWQRFE